MNSLRRQAAHTNLPLMSNHPRQTLIYSPTFRWTEALLEQEVMIIQHYPERDRDVGIFHEWHPVKIKDRPIQRISHILKSETVTTSKKPDTSYLDKVVPVTRNKSHPYTLKCDRPTWPDVKHDAQVPEGYTLVEFDGGFLTLARCGPCFPTTLTNSFSSAGTSGLAVYFADSSVSMWARKSPAGSCSS